LFVSRGKKTVKTIAIIVALCAAGLIVAQSNIPLGARLKLHWKGSTVYLREGATEHELDVRDQFHAVRLDKVVLQSAKDAGGFIYLLLDVTGPSKLPQDSHQCGAGYESDLIWLKLDTDWKVQNTSDFRYESCWSTISADDPPKWTGDTLTVSVFSVEGGKSVSRVATYSYKHPEDGIKVTETPADQ
jgi:hypothetical protein